MGAQPKHCPACQSGLIEGGKFCGYCGFKLSAISEAKHEALTEEIRTSGLSLDPLPALSGQQEAGAEGDTRADVFADTFADGRRLEAERAPTMIHPDRRPADPLEQTAPTPPVKAFAHDPALDDTALQRSATGTAALLQSGPPGEVVLAPAAALPGAAPVEGVDKTAGGTLSYDASPLLRPAPLTAEGRANNPSGRRMNRFPIKVEVSYTSAHNFYTGVIENVSSGGLFVATDEPGPIGEEYEVSFTVPGINKTCQAVCQVRWTRAGVEGRHDAGMGLRFVKLDAVARAAIELFLRHREPILYEEG